MQLGRRIQANNLLSSFEHSNTQNRRLMDEENDKLCFAIRFSFFKRARIILYGFESASQDLTLKDLYHLFPEYVACRDHFYNLKRFYMCVGSSLFEDLYS